MKYRDSNLSVEPVKGETTCWMCNKTDGNLYTTEPARVRCTITNKYNSLEHICDAPTISGDADASDSKPRICEVLGGKDNPLEVGEQFGISTMPGVVFWICKDGTFDTCPGNVRKSAYHFLRAVEHPEAIIRKPRFTEEEVAIAQGLHRVWPDGELSRRAPDDLELRISNQYGFVMPVPADMFSGLRPGQSVALSDIR